MALWEKSRDLDASFAGVHRNLGWSYYRALSDVPKAIQSYEQAVARANQDPRWFLELDTLYELGNVEPARRLAALEKILSDPTFRKAKRVFHGLVTHVTDSLLVPASQKNT